MLHFFLQYSDIKGDYNYIVFLIDRGDCECLSIVHRLVYRLYYIFTIFSCCTQIAMKEITSTLSQVVCGYKLKEISTVAHPSARRSRERVRSC